MKLNKTPQTQAGSKLTVSDRHDFRRLAYLIACLGVSAVTIISGNVINLLALKIGAKDVFLGFLNFAMLVPVVFGVLTMTAIERIGKIKILVFWHKVLILIVLCYLFLPLAGKELNVNISLLLLFILVFMRTAIESMAGTGWFPLLQDNISGRITGRFFASIRIRWQSAVLATTLLVAVFLGKNPAWWKFEALFAAAAVLYIVKMNLYRLMKEIPSQTVHKDSQNILKRFVYVFKNHDLRQFSFYIISYMFGIFFCEPFKVKILRDSGYSYGFILAATSMVAIGAIFSLRAWGKLADRFGNRLVFSISHFGMIVSTFLWVFVKQNSFNEIFVFGLYFIWSVFHNGNGISQTRYLLHAVPNTRQNCINIINILSFLALGIAPVFGGVFLSLKSHYSLPFGVELSNYSILFIIASILLVIPDILKNRLKAEKRIPAKHILIFVTRPLFSRFSPFAAFFEKNEK